MKDDNEKKQGGSSDIDPKMLARIQSLRLMDDDFMTVVFSSDKKLTELLLKILLSRDDLRVQSVMTQQEKHNIFGRSVRLDILAVDENGAQYNIEIQRADKGASERRARYNQAMIDSHTLKSGEDFAALPETYIIFITENDYYGEGEAVYTVKQCIETKSGKVLTFDDGTHKIYVNGSYRGEDAIGKLMHDFSTPNADEMNYKEIADTVRFHKQQEGGTRTMCRVFEEYGNERAAEARAAAMAETRNEFVEDLLRQNKLTNEEIAAVAKVPLEQVKQIAERIAAPAMA